MRSSRRAAARSASAGSRTSVGEGPPLADDPIEAVGLGFTTAGRAAIEIPGGLAGAVGGLIGLNPEGAGDARGPIGIAQITGEVIDAGMLAVVQFIGILSINLAILNVLPFPPLDGGRIAVVLIEAVRRRRCPRSGRRSSTSPASPS